MSAPTATLGKATAGTTRAPQLLARLGSSEAGLSDAEAAERRSSYGSNTLTRDRQTAWRVLLRQFQSPLVYFLVVAAILSYSTGDTTDGTVIVVILLLNAVVGFSQEYRSEKAVEQLAHLIANKVPVRRGGQVVIVPTGDLVPGDIVELKEGDVVPADVKLLDAHNVEVDESQLTGESVAVAKTVQADDAGSGDASLLFTGSVVDSGEVTGLVYATGDDTAFGQIAAMSRGVHKVTQYQKSLASFSTLLMKIVLVSLAVTVAIKLVVTGGSEHPASLFVFVIALAVSVVPEALPVIATLTLARGALQMAKQRVVVKRLASLEDLGDVTLMCSDKTGTLTEGKPTVTKLVSGDDGLFQTLVAASLDPASRGQEGTQAAFDAAFDAYVPDAAKQQATEYSVIAETPFDPAARRRRVLLAKSGTAERVLVVIGSPETLLGIAACPRRKEYLDQIAAEGAQGMRHLAVAYRDVSPAEPADPVAEEHDLMFLGFVALSDPLRPGTADTIAQAGQLGVAVKVLTGDSAEVAGYVAGQIGLVSKDAPVLTGDDLAKLPEDGLAAAAQRSNVFARVSPDQKYALISAFKSTEVVGYQGDGINDAPSLKLAEVGIAVDTATDVAKASADIILLSPGLAVVINGIRSGRAIFANINKYVVYTMVGNFGNFLALSLLYLLATALPLLPRQLLLISLLTDVPLVAISTDSVISDELARPSKYDARSLLSTSLVLGVLTAIAELIFFASLHGQRPVSKETSLYLFLSFTQLVVIFSVRNRDHFWKANRMSTPLAAAMAVTAGVTLAIPYTHGVGHFFGFHPPSAAQVGAVLFGSAVYLFVLDAVKVAFYRIRSRRFDVRRRSSAPVQHAATGAH